ncbi:hypothetical protein COU17_02110 [Candidatus Kaiserbacteria bacterium CG10_big_fil_rev_8_21_14_0_10_49_17]|uniref:DUF2065 domain-containing protein n=1 Tax=Candidatus Kaiserbacteria bacterium CG10_big_fil_rev_8_21_14_0_10_49_17 TaxID=1974609 RepID=A0A2M6WEA2_9BACT|nr:MAG: hypothetical protein COU17_02110 [Candidatus Kaiserbacteria bacterium CG10_big_fil_rev_8_21_14_0_10_49_17]
MESLTTLLAQIIGMYFLVAGISGFLNPTRMQKAIDEVTKSYLLPYLDGAMGLLMGLILVLIHNVWDDLLTSVISAIGWIALIEGVLIMFLPQESVARLYGYFADKKLVAPISLIAIVVGAYLTYSGFYL